MTRRRARGEVAEGGPCSGGSVLRPRRAARSLAPWRSCHAAERSRENARGFIAIYIVMAAVQALSSRTRAPRAGAAHCSPGSRGCGRAGACQQPPDQRVSGPDPARRAYFHRARCVLHWSAGAHWRAMTLNARPLASIVEGAQHREDEQCGGRSNHGTPDRCGAVGRRHGERHASRPDRRPEAYLWWRRGRHDTRGMGYEVRELRRGVACRRGNVSGEHGSSFLGSRSWWRLDSIGDPRRRPSPHLYARSITHRTQICANGRRADDERDRDASRTARASNPRSPKTSTGPSTRTRRWPDLAHPSAPCRPSRPPQAPTTTSRRHQAP